jgi:rubrerythrin
LHYFIKAICYFKTHSHFNMKEEIKESLAADVEAGISRRSFLGFAGVAGAAVLLSACDKEDDAVEPVDEGTVDLGSGDTGLLNFAYALEQLEAAFYVRVCSSFYADASEREKALLQDVRRHEIAHRELFRTALAGNAIPDLEFDFGSINFNDRTSVLSAAKEMEDTGVAAYNGAGKLMATPENLKLAAKIVSVEARHAAYFRELISVNSFSDTADANGVDASISPVDVLTLVSKYFKTKVSGKNLPKA